MPIMENVRLSLRQSRKFGKEIDPESKFGLLSASVTSCSGSGYGSGFSNTPFTTENRAVFAPMPNASVRIATAANTGDLAIIRTPNRKSCMHRSRNFPHQFHIPKLPSRCPDRFLIIHTSFHALPCCHLQVAPHFFVQLFFPFSFA